ncbi:hypothetical protein M9458_051619 [Cirrhinus mrigala]|uniref:Gypsy retrotransposon integrase-like protein 1 n=1 Tax=Cirrhinus mrigala TaxID=683832 RepID=A0ABD0MSK6_CIRMR
MEFNVEEFRQKPSREALALCRKTDLYLIAESYDIPIVKTARKKDVREVLLTVLVQQGSILSIQRQYRKYRYFRIDPPIPSIDMNEKEGTCDEEQGASGEVLHSLAGLSTIDLQLAIQLKQLDLEVKRQEHTTQLLRFRQCELELQAGKRPPSQLRTTPVLAQDARDSYQTSDLSFSVSPNSSDFDVSRQINLVPPFRESEVDSYFGAFERIAIALRWPKEVWSLLLQCRLIGKAQEVCSSFSVDDSLNYDKVKCAVLRAYELVPEAYRQKFRSHMKSANQTFVEYAREKGVLFDKWCQSSKTNNFEQLRVLIEDFKNSLPDKIVVYLNEKKVSTLAEAAVCADEFVLTHKNVFLTSGRREPFHFMNSDKNLKTSKLMKSPEQSDVRECFYCHEVGHLIAVCPALKKKNKLKQTKSVGFVRTVSQTSQPKIDDVFEPFVGQGMISLTGLAKDQVPVTLLRDTGTAQSFILQSALIFSKETYCGSDVLVQGIELGIVKVPLHKLHLQSKLITGFVKVAVRSELPVKGISMIIGNDLAGGKFFDEDALDSVPLQPEVSDSKSLSPGTGAEINSIDVLLSVDRKSFIAEQARDPSLTHCKEVAVMREVIETKSIGYFFEDGVLMRKWTPSVADESGCDMIFQIIVPKCFREQVLSVAHDKVAGHLGVAKTRYRVTRHFWPGINSDVSKFCRSCHTCQMVGKPNQVISPAPLTPIPVIGEPFDRIVLDCVGPLPKTKSGHAYLLTLMCAATRFPEAIPILSLRAKTIVKALVGFFSTFGLPRVVQTDQGTNFMSRVFNQILTQLHIKHIVSSPYHPESQGSLERFHQTLKTMLRTYCTQSEKEWDEGLPLLLFAVRETVQESLGFSPAELVFAHTVRGPLKLLKENWLSEGQAVVNVLDYVSSFRERLHRACELAQSALSDAQSKMKEHFDKRATARSFEKGDQVLVLLPLLGSLLQAKFSGPYVVERKLSDTDYIIRTPDRRRKTRVCHINMIKRYVVRGKEQESKSSIIPSASISVVPLSCTDEDNDELCLRSMPTSSVRLNNSEVLSDLNSYLLHLSDVQRADVVKLINSFLCLFSDVPTQTNVVKHDIEVHDHPPIKQNACRVNPTKRKIIESEVKYLVENGLAVPSSSAWSSPCLLVPKPDGTHRFCTDYRKVNAITKPDSFPLPLMEDCVDDVGSAQFVTKLDLLKGYWQVPLTERAAEIAAFVTPDNFLNYTVMAFGLRNAPATFQRLMNSVLAGVQNCKAYLDDTVVYSSSWKKHVDTLTIVFTRLRDASLTLNLSKCEFAKATVTYLGKQVGQGQVRPVAQKVQAIVDFPVPQTKRELRRFLGMAGYYRAFCRNFSDVALPLTDLLRLSQKFVWDAACQHAFNAIKTLLCSVPVLAAPDYSRTFKIDVDASATGAGAVLLQDDADGVEHPVAYFSKKFLPHL